MIPHRKTLLLLSALSLHTALLSQAIDQQLAPALNEAKNLLQQGILDQAGRLLDRSWAELEEQSSSTTKYDCLALLAMFHLSSGNGEEAETYSRMNLDVSTTVFGQNSFEHSTAHNSLGNILIRRQQIDEALQEFNEAYRILRMIPNSDLRFHVGCLNNIASIHADHGMYGEAIKEWSEALQLAEDDVRFTGFISTVYYNLSGIKRILGHFDEAKELLLLARETFVPGILPMQGNEINFHSHLAKIHLSQKKHAEAINSFETLLQLAQGKPAYNGFAVSASLGLCRIYLDQENIELAEKHNKACQDLLRSAEDLDMESWLASTILLSKLLQLQGRTEQAIDLLHSELQRGWDKHETHETIWDGYLQLGALLLEQGREEELDQVLAHCAKMDDLLSERTQVNASLLNMRIATRELQANHELLQFHRKGGRKYLDQGLSQILSLDTLLARNRMMLYADRDLLLMDAHYASATEVGLELVWQLHQLDPAASDFEAIFSIMEQNKANALQRALLEDSGALFAQVPDSVVRLLRSYTYQINKVQEHIQNAAEQDRLPLQNRAAALLLSREKIQSEILHNYPDFHALLSQGRRSGFEVQTAQLAKDHLFVEYRNSPTGLYALSALNGRTVFTRIDPQVMQLIDRWSKMLSQPYSNVDRLLNLGVEISNALLFELYPDMDFDKLTVVPDGSTCVIPFAALTKINSDGEQEYLCRSVEIQYTVSARLPRSERSPIQRELIYKGFAPQYAMSNTNTPWSAALTDTPHSREAVARLGAELGSSLYLGEQASLINFLSDRGPSKILHIAGHSTMDLQDHLNTAIHFSTSDAGDDLLTAGVIYGLELDHELVVLGACRSGDGMDFSGEGLLSLSRAFQYAGCRSMISSLWNVADESSAGIAEDVILSVAAGQSAAQGLRAAQLQVLDNEELPQRLKHPYHWAAFTAYGNSTAPMDESNRPFLLFVTSVFLLMLYIKTRK